MLMPAIIYRPIRFNISTLRARSSGLIFVFGSGGKSGALTMESEIASDVPPRFPDHLELEDLHERWASEQGLRAIHR